MSNKRRSFMIILTTLIVILISVVPIYAESPSLFSAIVSNGSNSFLTPPGNILISGTASYPDWGDYDFAYTLDPVIPLVDNIVYPETVESSSGTGSTVADLSVSNRFTTFFNDDLVYDSSRGTVYGLAGMEFTSFAQFSEPSFGSIDNSDGFNVTIRDFYCWVEDDNHPQESEVRLTITTQGASFGGAEIIYSLGGDTEVQTLWVDPGEYRSFDQLDFDIDPVDLLGVPDVQGTYVYIHQVSYFVDYSFSDELRIEGYLSYFFDSGRVYELQTARGFDADNPAIPLLDYTRWLGTAVSGFLDLQIFPNFTIGGILMTLIAFSCVIWFLKMFAGG